MRVERGGVEGEDTHTHVHARTHTHTHAYARTHAHTQSANLEAKNAGCSLNAKPTEGTRGKENDWSMGMANCCVPSNDNYVGFTHKTPDRDQSRGL